MNKLYVVLVSLILQYASSHVCNENNEHFESATDLDIQGFDFFNPEHQTFEDVESYLNRFHFWTLDNVHTRLLCQKICNWFSTCRAYSYTGNNCMLYGSYDNDENSTRPFLETIYIDLNKVDDVLLYIEDLICENGVTIVSVSASSEWISSRDHGPTSACLDKEMDAISTGGWVAAEYNLEQWIMADLQATKVIYKVTTQGRSDNLPQYVTSYNIEYSGDAISWDFERNSDNSVKIFSGNFDRNTKVSNLFDPTIRARLVKLHVLDWRLQIALRWDLQGLQQVA